MKGILLIFLREIKLVGKTETQSQYILYYRHKLVRKLIEVELLSTLEIPYEIAESEMELEFEIEMIAGSEEVSLTSQIKLSELKIEEISASPRTFSLSFKKEGQESVFLVFDCFYRTSKQIIDPSKALNMFHVRFHSLDGLELFLANRNKLNKTKKLLASFMWDYKYFIELEFKSQKYLIDMGSELSLSQTYDFFYNSESMKNNKEKLIISIKECEYEKRSVAVNASLDLISVTPIFEKVLENPDEFENGLNLIEEVFDLKFSLEIWPERNGYIHSVPGYFTLKILSSNTNIPLENPLLMISNYDGTQSWVLQSLGSSDATSPTSTKYYWDKQYYVVNEKISQEAKANEASKIEFTAPPMSEGLNKLEDVGVNPSFDSYLNSLNYIGELQKVIDEDGLQFSRQKNHIFFKSRSPLEYFKVEFFTSDISQKNLQGRATIGLHKTVNDSFSVGYLENKEGDYCGSFTFIVSFLSDSEGFVPESAKSSIDINKEIDHDNLHRNIGSDLVVATESLRKHEELLLSQTNNFFKQNRSIFGLKIKILDIIQAQELFDHFEQENIDEIFIKGKLGTTSQIQSIFYKKVLLSTFKNENKEMICELERDGKTQCSKNKSSENQKAVYSLNIGQASEVGEISFDNSEQGCFEFLVSSYMEPLVFEISSKSRIIGFFSCTIKNLPIMVSSGTVMLLPIKVKERTKLNVKRFGSNVVFLKVSVVVSDFHKHDPQSFASGLFTFSWIKAATLFKNLQSLRNNLYEFVFAIDGKERAKKYLKFTPETFETNANEIFSEAELSTQASLKILVYRVYSEDDEEFLFLMNTNKSIKSPKILLHETNITLNGVSNEQGPNDANMSFINVPPNSYEIFEVMVSELQVLPDPSSAKVQNASNIIPIMICVQNRGSEFIENPQGYIRLNLNEEDLKNHLNKKKMNGNMIINFMMPDNTGRKKVLTFDISGKPNDEDFLFQCDKISDSFFVDISENKKIVDCTSLKLASLPIILEEAVSFAVNIGKCKLRGTLVYSLINVEDEIKNEVSQGSQGKSGASKVSAQGAEGKKKRKIDPIAEKLEKIKSKINALKEENVIKTAELNKERNALIKEEKTMEDIEFLISKSDPNVLKHPHRLAKPLQLTDEQIKWKNKAKELRNSICVCGESDPKFKGYCLKCVKLLKENYEKDMMNYLPVSDKYESVYLKNINTKAKIIKMKKKIDSLKNKIRNSDFSLETTEDSFIRESFNFYKEKKLLLLSEIDIIKKETRRKTDELGIQQENIEKKVIKKTNRLQALEEEIVNAKLQIETAKKDINLLEKAISLTKKPT